MQRSVACELEFWRGTSQKKIGETDWRNELLGAAQAL